MAVQFGGELDVHDSGDPVHLPLEELLDEELELESLPSLVHVRHSPSAQILNW